MVPNGWDVQSLSSITKWSSGGTPSKNNPDYWNGEIPWISAASMRGHYFEKSELRITDLAVSNGAKMAPKDSLLLLVRGSMLWNKIPVGITAKKVSFNQDVKCLVPHVDELTTEFLLYWFLTYEHRLMNMVTGTGIGAGKLDTTDLQSLDVFLPPLPEQRKIAQILSTWDRGIATTEKLIDASKQQKKALMQQLLTGKKRLVDPETGKAFEGEWERHSLSDLVYVDRKSLGKKTPDNFKFKYISLSHVDFGVISKELEVHEFSAAPSRARRVLQDGDILMSTVRPNLKGFAKVTSCYADCIASTGFAVLTPKKKVSGDYIYQYIFSAHVTGQIDSLVVGSNYPAINSSDVSGLKVYCPAFEEQQKIASVLTAVDKDIELLEAKLAHLKQEKKALMQQLLTGKRRVQVAETEAA
ncbi:restriction endonuclease subunit S [Vibrio harveyi]|uniref:restriction endonuclease subunit S n=1 Tax=Vibrio harveyi TaxID=669 RepID=UPI0008419F94|nr:restriction endonuclease subunit S [Vibrio harveyi]ODM56932.1 restriction endonuclease subunit S [Vibrio harveyi]